MTMSTLHKLAYLAGTRAAQMKLGALDLEFATEEDLRKHQARRNALGNVGGFAGSVAGGAAGMAAGGPIGSMAGSVGGQILKVPAQTLADVAHDIPYRTAKTYRDTNARLERAGGFGQRIAAAMPMLEDAPGQFVAFAAEDETKSRLTPQPEADVEDPRLQPGGWGPASNIDAGNAAAKGIPTVGPSGAV